MSRRGRQPSHNVPKEAREKAKLYEARLCPDDVGTLVWAVKDKSLAWPAVIVTPPNYVLPNDADAGKPYCIYYFGSKSFGWTDRSNMQPYDDKTEFLKYSNGTAVFKEALKDIEAFHVALITP